MKYGKSKDEFSLLSERFLFLNSYSNYTFLFYKIILTEKSLFLFILVPPLEGFVMNRVQGDYFETLLYKIFVSIDEHTNVAEVSVPTSYEEFNLKIIN